MSNSRQLATWLKVPFAVFMVFTLAFGSVVAEQSADVGENLNQPSEEIATPSNVDGAGEDEGDTNPPAEDNEEIVPPADNGGEVEENSGEGEVGENGDNADPAASPDTGVNEGGIENEGTEKDDTEGDAGSEAGDANEVDAGISTSSMEIQATGDLPSTNEANRTNNQAHVVHVNPAACGEITLQFNNTTDRIAYFEVLVDGVQVPHDSPNVGGPHQWLEGDTQYGGYNIIADDYSGNPLTNTHYTTGHTVTYEGANEVKVRFALGGPSSSFFDWTSFTAEPCPPVEWVAPSTNDENREDGLAHVIQLEADVCGTVTLQFNNETQYIAHFEVLVDGVQVPNISPNVGKPHQTVTGDIQYGGYNVVHPTNYTGAPLTNTRYDHGLTMTYEGSEVQVRFALGWPNTSFFDWTSFTSEPCPVAEGVVVNVTSADPQVANALPADASWVVSLDGAVLDGDTFAAEHLQLPAEIAVNNPVPVGTYDVTINAEPVFEPFTGQIEVTEESRVFNIELQPVVEDEEPTPTEPVDPDPTPTEPVDPDPTPTEPVTPGTQSLVIQVQLPGGEDIEGAPYSLYAPVAAQQFMAEPYAQGFVGPDNTIRIDGLIEGIYRLVIEPEGMEPIEVLVAVGNDPVTEAVIIVDENGEATVVYAGQEPPVTETPEAETETPTPTSSVTGLPETGQGSTSPVGSMLVAAAFSVVLLGAGAFAVRRHHS